MPNDHDQHTDITPEEVLETELGMFSSLPEFVAGVRLAVGGDPVSRLEPDSGLVCHLINVTDGLVSAYLLVEGGLVVFQRADNGETLTVAIPLYRLGRVEVRTDPAGRCRAVFELDADITTARNADGGVQVTERAGYVIEGEADSAPAVLAFATEVRCLLLGL